VISRTLPLPFGCVIVALTWVCPGDSEPNCAARASNMEMAAACATASVCCSIAGVSAASAAASAAALSFDLTIVALFEIDRHRDGRNK